MKVYCSVGPQLSDDRLSGQPRAGFTAPTVATHRTTRWGVSLVSGALASRCTKVIRVVIVLYCELPEL